MKVEEIMTKDPACCYLNTNVEEVARMMCGADCGEIPVVERGSLRLLGVVTDRDIVCRAVARARNPHQMTAEECMTVPPIAVSPGVALEHCAELMEKHRIRRVPVVDANRVCLGIVSQADLARHLPDREAAEVLRAISEPAASV